MAPNDTGKKLKAWEAVVVKGPEAAGPEAAPPSTAPSKPAAQTPDIGPSASAARRSKQLHGQPVVLRVDVASKGQARALTLSVWGLMAGFILLTSRAACGGCETAQCMVPNGSVGSSMQRYWRGRKHSLQVPAAAAAPAHSPAPPLVPSQVGLVRPALLLALLPACRLGCSWRAGSPIGIRGVK